MLRKMLDEPPQPVAGHTPGEDWQWEEFDHGFCLITQDKGRGLDNDVDMICQGYMGKENAALIASAPRLARENTALRHQLEIILAMATPVATLPWEKTPVTNLAKLADAIKRQAALALSSPSPATIPPQPRSDAATGTPEGKEGVLMSMPCGDCDPCLGGRPDQCALFPTKE